MDADGYTDADRARLLDEPPSRSGRGAFARDRARVLHSGALRRLAGKTQVVEPGGAGTDWPGAVPRTRLTHSLECAQVGRELGAALGCDPDLVDAACLAHDLGHPPFGHNGERALDAVAGPCGGFEGNAQSLRVLTRLEVKHEGAGLNLTRAALDAATKYPWTRRAPEGSTRHKYGAYDDDLPVFRWLRAGSPRHASESPGPPASDSSDATRRDGERRSLETQVMDWADDVAYSVHDLEDGIAAGMVPVARLRDPDERDAVCAVAARRYVDEPADALREVFDDLLGLTAWPSSYGGTARDQAALKATTTALIGRFCRAALQTTRARHGEAPLRRYAADLVVPRTTRAECGLLKAVAARYVMDRPGVHAVQDRERELLTELTGLIAERGPDALEPARAEDWRAAADDAGRLRAVVDQVASLTDASASALHARLLAGSGRPGRDRTSGS